MKKEEFLKLLYDKLLERGVDKEVADRETSHVRTYLTESGTEELNVSLDEMVDGIISMIESGKSNKSGGKRASVPITPKTKGEKKESVSDELGEAIANMEDDQRKPTQPHTPDNDDKKSKGKVSGKQKKAKNTPESEGVEKRSLLYRMMEKIDKAIKHRKKIKEERKSKKIRKPKKEKKSKVSSNTKADISEIEEYIPISQKEKVQYDSNGKMKNAWLYVSILVVAIPIAVILLLIAVILYVGFWVALALMMIAFIALLVSFVAVGAFVSIVGIVYGVVSLITGSTPVGLFEIGLGIVVGSAVMFIGILIYNLSVRFIPFIMKLLAKLFKLGFRALRTGYIKLKGAVSEL